MIGSRVLVVVHVYYAVLKKKITRNARKTDESETIQKIKVIESRLISQSRKPHDLLDSATNVSVVLRQQGN